MSGHFFLVWLVELVVKLLHDWKKALYVTYNQTLMEVEEQGRNAGMIEGNLQKFSKCSGDYTKEKYEHEPISMEEVMAGMDMIETKRWLNLVNNNTYIYNSKNMLYMPTDE